MLSLCRTTMSVEEAAINKRMGPDVPSAGLSHHTKNGKRRCGHHAAQGNITRDRDHNDEQDERNQDGAWGERRERPHCRRHAFASLEAAATP